MIHEMSLSWITNVFRLNLLHLRLCSLALILVSRKTEASPMMRNRLLPSQPAGPQLGICFDEHHSAADTCTSAIGLDVTKEQCCREGVLGRGWAPHANVSSSQWFFWSLRYNGVPECSPCHDTCRDVQCGSERRCRMRNGAPKCVCSPDCSNHSPKNRGHVCGTDGNTYRNYCSLLKYNCKKRRSESVAYYGRCQYSCDRVTCESGKYCVLDQNAIPHCIHCQLDCTDSRNPDHLLCGGDGLTYPSMCHLMRATCLQGHSIGVAYRGQCQEAASCNTITCQRGQLCLTDPRDQSPRCTTCSSWCSPFYSTAPLCGTDDRTYHGWCEMHQNACATGTVIETKHYGACGTFPVSEIYNGHSSSEK